ncbi:ankyrin repeat domain-containing protein 26-like [Rhynchocyon petersi]
MLCEKIRDQLRKKEEQYSKEVEVKQQLEISLRSLEVELRTVRNNLDEVTEERNDAQKILSREQNARILQDGILTSPLCKQEEKDVAQRKTVPNSEVCESHEKEKDLMQANQMLQNKITMLTVELDTLKNQDQMTAEKYAEDIEMVKKENHDLQKTLQQKEETLANTVLQHSEQLKVLTTENAMLRSKLENEKQNQERLETEVESYRSRMTAVMQDHDQSQTSKRDLELDFHRAREEWLRLQDKMNFDLSTLKNYNESLSQQLSKTESQLNSLEIELQQTKDALREKTFTLERVERDFNHTQLQMKKVERMYQNEQGKVSKYIGRQESYQERLSVLDSENTLLRQQLDEAHNKVISEEKTIIDFQNQFHDIVKKLQVESEKQSLMLKERNKELIDECNNLKERICQYENEKAEREVVVRQLQQELADTLKKQSMSEASLEVIAHYRTSLEDENHTLKKQLGQITCQLEEAQTVYSEAIQRAEKMQEHIKKLEMENAQLKLTLKMQTDKAEHLQQNLLETNSSEDEEEQLKKLGSLKQSLASCLDPQLKKEELEKEIAKFKKLLKVKKKKLNDYGNKEFCFDEDYKTNEIERNIEKAMLKHKTQAISQEYLEKLRETNNTSARTQMELRIKELESELSKIKTSQEDFNKAELKKYKELYQDELKVRKAVSSKLNKPAWIAAPKIRVEPPHARCASSSALIAPRLTADGAPISASSGSQSWISAAIGTYCGVPVGGNDGATALFRRRGRTVEDANSECNRRAAQM